MCCVSYNVQPICLGKLRSKMSPAIHPACTPSAVCLEKRCHSTGPPCSNPQRCLKRSRARRVKPCPSAVSIMETRSKNRCDGCNRFKQRTCSPRSIGAIERFLREKRKQERLKEIDLETGTSYYERYMLKKGRVRNERKCCEGAGNRGRLKKKRVCAIL